MSHPRVTVLAHDQGFAPLMWLAPFTGCAFKARATPTRVIAQVLRVPEPQASLLTGTLDTTFDPGAGTNGEASAVAIRPSDGQVLVGGDFTTVDGSTHNRLARLDTNGNVDSAFNPDVNEAVPQSPCSRTTRFSSAAPSR